MSEGNKRLKIFYINLGHEIAMKVSSSDSVVPVHPACEYVDEYDMEKGNWVKAVVEIPEDGDHQS